MTNLWSTSKNTLFGNIICIKIYRWFITNFWLVVSNPEKACIHQTELERKMDMVENDKTIQFLLGQRGTTRLMCVTCEHFV